MIMAAATEDITTNLSLDKLSLGEDKQPEDYLHINHQRMGSMIPLKFEDFKLLGKFSTTKDQTYSDTEVDIPQIISLHEMNQLKGKNLGDGYSFATLLSDYSKYHEMKQDYFFKWLKGNDYFRQVEKKVYKKPEFVCFGGRITDPLQTPLKTRFGEWEIFAAKYLDSIFIWDEKLGSDSKHKHTKESFYGIAFEALTTGSEPGSVNEFEKTFFVQEASFGSHQLLLVNEIDAVDENGEFVEIKVYKKCSPLGMQAKYLGYWAQSIVAGVKNITTGHRDDSGYLREIATMSMDETISKANCISGVKRCYDFEDRLLTWIGSHFSQNDPKVVKKFSWLGAPNSKVTCRAVRQNEYRPFFPQWFLDATTAKLS